MGIWLGGIASIWFLGASILGGEDVDAVRVCCWCMGFCDCGLETCLILVTGFGIKEHE
jgi:hypothetical protein